MAEVRMSRARLYVLLDAFEHDMREILERYVLDHLDERTALGPEYTKANELRSSDVGDDSVAITHYLNLRPCYDILNRHRAALPAELGEELRANTGRLDDIVQIRNRVMHGRPLRGEDPEIAISALGAFLTRHWVETRNTLRRLREDVTWEPPYETLPLSSERILHNLPLADYDETGLVGRGSDVTRLKTMLQRRREPVITITGEGGIGKTALALEVAYAIVDDPASDYDCVLWVSLKSEVLTASGVRSIERAISSITGAALQLGSALDESFDGSVKELADALRGLTALIVVDNLETAQGDDVIRLYDALPESVTFLFTSRIGLGQLERRVPLGPLHSRDASLLFRKLAATRQLAQLLRLSDTAINQIVERLRFSPLAIKWYVLSVEAGKEPISTLRDQRELVEFCVGNVYAALSPRARTVLSVLDATDRPLAFDELAVLTDMSIDDLRAAAQEAGRGAMVVHQADPAGGLVSRLSLSVAAQLFLARQTGRHENVALIQRREEQYRQRAEQRKVVAASRSLGPNIVRSRSSEDEPVVHLLDLALQHSRRGDVAQAQSLIDRARAINPEYWEVDRVAAFIASTQRMNSEANALYRSALSHATSDEERAIVSYYLAGHMARALRDVEGAIEYAEYAHSIIDTPETAMQLGNFLVWSHDFSRGQALLESALDSATGRAYLIAATGLVESWRRWGEEVFEQRNLGECVEKAFTGFVVGTQVLGEGYVDLRLANEVLESAGLCLRAMSVHGASVDGGKARKIVDWLESNRELAEGTRGLTAFRRTLMQFDRENSLEPVLSAKVRLLAQGNEREAGPGTDKRLTGEVLSWSGRYGFIAHPEHPRNVFFHAGLVARGASVSQGDLVSFRIDAKAADGRPRALDVKPLTGARRSLS